MNISGTIVKAINAIGPLDEDAMRLARSRQEQLTKPPGSLGRLEDLSVQMAGIQARQIPEIKDKAIVLMAGDHGVIAENIVNWPQEVTAQMVKNIIQGGAGINVLAREVRARIVVVDMGVATDLDELPGLISKKISAGTGNIALGPAMTSGQAVAAIEAGIEVAENEIKKGADIIGTGEMGICNTTPSSAIYAVMSDKHAREVTGRGTGIDDVQLAHKVEVIERALVINHPNPRDPVEVLAKVGGFEIGGLVGVMLGAAAHHVPVVIDGFITGAAALLAMAMAPMIKEYIIASHVSAEAGHQGMLDHMGFEPLMNLDMRLGEGSGAALGIFMAETSVKILSEMATFSEAGVSEGKEE